MAKKPTKDEKMNRLIEEMEELAEAKKWETLKAKADEFIKKFPDKAEGYFYRGAVNLNNSDFRIALGNFNKACELDLQHENAFDARGLAKMSLEDYQGALQDFDKAIALNASNRSFYNNRASVKFILEDYQGALEDCDAAIRISSEYSSAFNVRGGIKRALRDYRGALSDFNKAIELAPSVAEPLSNRGNMKQELGEHEEAIEDYSEAINIKPQESSYYFNRGNSKFKIDDFEGALEDYEKAISIDPEKESYHHNRAIAIGRITAKETEENLTGTFENILNETTKAYDAQLKEFTDPQKIIELYEDEINRSSLRTYGTKSFATKEEDQQKKAERLKTADKPIKKFAWHIWHGLGHFSHWLGHRVLPNCLEKKASYASFLLRVFVIAIFAFLLVLFLANNLFDFISILFKFSLSGFTDIKLFKGHISDITIEKALSFISFQAILSAPFYLYARRVNREFQEERVRLHALMRDRNLLLFWSAQDRENKALFSGKLFDQMTQSSTADLSLRMMNPKQAVRFQEARRPLIQGDNPYDKESQDKRDANLLEKIADLTK